MPNNYDFGGYATRNDLLCSDGRIIRRDAFKHNDGKMVPLVYQHLHDDPNNVLGHAMLENRADGVYAYCRFNNTETAKVAKELVQHGDLSSLSIHANKLTQNGTSVLHGEIREVSLVLAGANPGALIDNVEFKHSDGSIMVDESEALIFTNEPLTLVHAAATPAKAPTPASESDETMQDVFNTLNEKQKTVVYAMIAAALGDGEDGEIKQSAMYNEYQTPIYEGGNPNMKHNVFDNTNNSEKKDALTHSDFQTIMADAKKCGSFRDAFIQHTQTYGITDIEYLFPDARNVNGEPVFIKRDTGWVATVINGTKHSPFSRIKSLAADITADAARALGYVKGKLKKEEIISLLKRTTTPTTIYKKQKVDRDDIIDITDFNVIAWLKMEMRMMLDEELARAILIGDGRDPESGDKINEGCIRPIWTDADLYAHHVAIEDTVVDYLEIVDEIIKARKYYKGSGNPVFYTSTDFVTNLRLLKDITGRRLFLTDAELCSYLRVSKIEEVSLMDELTRTSGLDTLKLIGIFVNLNDYVVGADKGGAINNFEDFDIDYNQQKYLIETRCSGALILPKSALVIEQKVTE